MAERSDESDLEKDWTFVEPGTIESVEARQGSVFYSKRRASQSSDGAPYSTDVSMGAVESSGSEAEFEVLPLLPAKNVPDGSSLVAHKKSEVDVKSPGANNTDMPNSVSSDEGTEMSHCLDDGIMIISNHFSPGLEEECDNSPHSLPLSSSFLGWQELPQLAESSTSFISEEQGISDDEAGIVTISDDADNQEIEFIQPGEVDEEDSGSECSESSSFLFDGDLFDVSCEELEVLDLSETFDTDTTSQHCIEQHANDESEGNGSDNSHDDDDSDGEGGDGDGNDEVQEVSGDVITVDAPTFIILLCLTTALGFSIGHGLSIYLSYESSANPSHLKRPGPDTASFPNEDLSLKFPEDNANQEQVHLWKEKEASIALMFDLKELHSKLQREHFSLLKSYDALKKRLHVSKVMGWYWRWKFQHGKADGEKLGWNKALETQVERLRALYTHEKRLADLWRGVQEKEARNKLPSYWKALHRRWVGSSVQSKNDATTEANLKTSFSSAEVCSDDLTAFKHRWTQDARDREATVDQYTIAVSGGQETRVFSWDHATMKAIRQTTGPASTKHSRNLLAIYFPGSPVKDIVIDPKKRNQDVNIPDSLQLVLEDGSIRDIFSHPNESEGHPAGKNEEGETEKDGKIDDGDHSEHAVPLYAEYYTSKRAKCPVERDGGTRLEQQEQLERRAVLFSKSGAESSKHDSPERADNTVQERKNEDSPAVEKQVATPRAGKRRVRKPCFEIAEKLSEEKRLWTEEEEAEEMPLANETIADAHRELEDAGKLIRRKNWLAREKKIRTERLARRKLKRREQDLGRHIRKAGKILQALFTERRRLTRQKAALRHERHNLEIAKGKLEDDRKQHQQNRDEVEKLIVQLKAEKQRLQKWHQEEEKALKQSLSMEIRKLKEDRQKYEKEKGAELKRITTKLSIERRKLKSDYKNLKALRKAARKEYKKWLKELRGMHKKDEKIREKTERRENKEAKRHEYGRRKHKDRDKRGVKDKAKKREKPKNRKEPEYSVRTVQSKAPLLGKPSAKQNAKQRKRKNTTSDNVRGQKTRDGQRDYRKQLENLKQWWLQINEQKLDQEQIQRGYSKPNIHRQLNKVPTHPRHDDSRKTAVQPEKNKAVVAFASIDLNVLSSNVHGTREEKPNSGTRREKRTATHEGPQRNGSSRKPPDVNPNPAVAGLKPNGPIPPDKRQGRRKPGGCLDWRQHYAGGEGSHRFNCAARQEPPSSRKSEPDGPIPPEGLRVPPDFRREREDEPSVPDAEESWYVRRAKERESLRKSSAFPTRKQRTRRSGAWIFGRASDRAEQRANWEPWYERRAKGRDEWRATHQDSFSPERNYYLKMMDYLWDWHERLAPRGPTKRRGCWGA